MTLLLPNEYEFILRNDLLTFTQRSFVELNLQTDLVLGPHIEVIATKLEACRRGEIKRLIINLPPRHLKSICASIAFPSWILGHNPTAQIICASYGQELSEKFARDCRTIMMSRWYQRLFQTRLSDRRAIHDFETSALGTRMSTSVGGVLTGRGADFIILDDPLKPEDALSESGRKRTNDWYDNTLLSRLNDKATGCIIIIMQRLHQDDLVGHVLEQEEWEQVSFPAIAEKNEEHVINTLLSQRTFKRAPGDALHPEKQSLLTLANVRETIGEYNFSSQYQQNPTPIGGAIVKTKWLRFYEPEDLPPSFNRLLQSWDTANKAAEINDYSACTTWGITDQNYYLLDVFRERLNFPELKRKVREHKARFKANTVIIEDKASGTQLIQELRAEGVAGVVPYLPPPHTDKIMRLHAQSLNFENGSILLPRKASWLTTYINELTSFPGSKFDDQVDSTTQALAHIRTPTTLDLWRRLGNQ